MWKESKAGSSSVDDGWKTRRAEGGGRWGWRARNWSTVAEELEGTSCKMEPGE